MLRKVLLGALVVVVLLGAVSVAAFFWARGWYERALMPVSESDPVTTEFNVEPGQDTATIAHALVDAGLVRDALAFQLMTRIQGTEGQLKAGRYILSSGASAEEIMQALVRGQIHYRAITIPEGLTVAEITERVLDSQMFEDAQWEAALAWARSDAGPLSGLLPVGDDVIEPLEGYLFPDTYLLSDSTGATRLVEMMVDRLLEVYGSLATESRVDAAELHHALTLASIVEREAVLDRERPTVAGVFANRLRLGMRLESCATVAYIIGREPLIRDLEVDHPYNTYVYGGLPPGPIANVGRASLSAAMSPADVRYLYFVARGDGSHAFAATFAEHLANVARYR